MGYIKRATNCERLSERGRKSDRYQEMYIERQTEREGGGGERGREI